MASRSRLRWGDTLDDEDGALPGPHVSTNGNIKTVTEYYRNDKGDAFKKTTKYKVVSVEKKVYKVGAGAIPLAACLQAWGEALLL